jgi:HAMP domain-containing protein
MTKIKTRLAQMAVAAILATGLLLMAQIDSTEATSAHKNGVMAFEIHDPTGDTEIFTA